MPKPRPITSAAMTSLAVPTNSMRAVAVSTATTGMTGCRRRVRFDKAHLARSDEGRRCSRMPRCSQVEHTGQELPRSRWSCEFQPNRAAIWLNDDAKGQKSAALALDLYDAGNRREHTFIRLETNAVAVRELYPFVSSSNEAAKQVLSAGFDGRRAESAHNREFRHVERSIPNKLASEPC